MYRRRGERAEQLRFHGQSRLPLRLLCGNIAKLDGLLLRLLKYHEQMRRRDSANCSIFLVRADHDDCDYESNIDSDRHQWLSSNNKRWESVRRSDSWNSSRLCHRRISHDLPFDLRLRLLQEATGGQKPCYERLQPASNGEGAPTHGHGAQ